MPRPTDFVPFGSAIDDYLFGGKSAKEAVSGISRDQVGNELLGIVVPGLAKFGPVNRTLQKTLQDIPNALVSRGLVIDELQFAFPKALKQKSTGKIVQIVDPMEHHAQRAARAGIAKDDYIAGFVDSGTGEFHTDESTLMRAIDYVLDFVEEWPD